MRASLIALIGAENTRLQLIPSTDEPALIESSYERLQKLVWDLKQLGPNASAVNRVWPILVRVGNNELRQMRGQYQNALRTQDTTAYVDAHHQLKAKIRETILPLFH
ncbi:hypothetical protein GO755_20435 [Spirosoma sp. HMF4905]|uniref:Uncharacterized protein n=1 Tax=Spirosoma arboris TaxID=2682092 RepID=A0A7K1SFT2_9BACT|nr:hypothetical protein [Spirosoma arboris]MVM32426.1 hypothetical protein [Spirosoma arboris]